MANVDCVLQVQSGGQRCTIGRIGVHIIADVSLARSAVTATVMRDNSVAVGQKKEHLGIPIVSRQRPAVVEDDWLTLPPIFVVNLRAVLCGNGSAAHECSIGLSVLRSRSLR